MKKQMTTQNRQKANAKKINFKCSALECFVQTDFTVSIRIKTKENKLKGTLGSKRVTNL